ncbi:hypothetical protein A2U01_0061022, partial [Trifolium medium]|nr:hypothetical protein [Trifolium medium]
LTMRGVIVGDVSCATTGSEGRVVDESLGLVVSEVMLGDGVSS